MKITTKIALLVAVGLIVGGFAITVYATYASHSDNENYLANNNNDSVFIAGKEYALKMNKEDLLREFSLTESDIELRANESGQTFGPAFYVPEPDLFRVGLPDGRVGYAYSKEFAPIDNLQERIDWMAYLDNLMQAEKLKNPEATKVLIKNIPVYESDGKTIIGSWPIEYQPAVGIMP